MTHSVLGVLCDLLRAGVTAEKNSVGFKSASVRVPHWTEIFVEKCHTLRISSSVWCTTRTSNYREHKLGRSEFNSHQFGWVEWIEKLSGRRKNKRGSPRGAPKCQCDAILAVPYFSLFKLKMIQSPDRALTRTSGLESSAYAPLRNMILSLRFSLSHE